MLGGHSQRAYHGPSSLARTPAAQVSESLVARRICQLCQRPIHTFPWARSRQAGIKLGTHMWEVTWYYTPQLYRRVERDAHS
eukprot:245846-Pyramimonas_sp.AAC.1